MKVLHIEAGKHLYGGALQVHYLTRALAKKGISNFLVSPHGAEIYDVAAPDVIQLPIKMAGDLDAAVFFRIRRLLVQHEVDLVHIHSRRGADFYGLLAAKSLGIPVVISRRVDNREPSWFARWKYHLASHVITISDGIRKVLLELGVKPSQVTTVLSAVDTQKYQPKTNRPWFEQEFEIEPGGFVVAIMAQMIKRKGHVTLFEAMHRLKLQNQKFTLLVFGKGPLEAELKHKVAEFGLTANVKFAGFRHDLDKILPNIDLVVHPAFAEGLGVALLQSSSCGVPMVAARAGGIPEAVIENQNGWLFTPGDVDQLSGILISILVNPALLKSYRKQCRTKAEQKFSIEAMASGNLRIYQQILSDRYSMQSETLNERRN